MQVDPSVIVLQKKTAPKKKMGTRKRENVCHKGWGGGG